MDQPGVEVRPIKMISGDSRVQRGVLHRRPRARRRTSIGEVNGGWAVAMTLLGYERGEAAATFPLMFRTELDRLVALAKERGAHRRPGHPPAAGVVPQQGRDHALPRAAVAHAVPRRPPARARSRASSSSSGASTTRRSPSSPSTSSAPTPWRPSRPLADVVVPDRLAGRPERQRQLGRHVLQRPGRHDLRGIERRSSATSSASWCSASRRSHAAPTPEPGASSRRPDPEPAAGRSRASRAVLPHPSLWRTGLRQVATARRARAGGAGRRSSRCRRPTTSGSGWRPPTAAPATSAPGRDGPRHLPPLVPQLPGVAATTTVAREPPGNVPAMSRALVLNATYEPLCVVPSRRAVVLVLGHKADMLHDTGEALHSEHLTLAGAVGDPAAALREGAVPAPRAAQPARRVRPRRPPLPVLRASRPRASTTSCRAAAAASTAGRTWWPRAVPATCASATGSSTRRRWCCAAAPTAPREMTWVVVAVGTVPQHWEPYLHPATLSA